MFCEGQMDWGDTSVKRYYIAAVSVSGMIYRVAGYDDDLGAHKSPVSGFRPD